MADEPPRLRERYKAFVVDGEGLFLVSDRDYQIFEGQVFVDLCPLLTGRLAESAIVDALEHKYSRATVHYAIGMLARHGTITTSPSLPDARAGAFWDELDLVPDAVARRLAALTVRVTCVGDVDAEPVVRALAALGVRTQTVEAPGDPLLQVVLTDDPLAPSIRSLADRNRQDERPWLLACGAGTEPWISPVFTAGGTCFECLRWRLHTNRSLEAYVGRRLGGKVSATRGIARIPPLDALMANCIALQVSKWAAGYPDEPPRVRSIDPRNLRIVDHQLKRRPQCAVCGNSQLQTEAMLRAVVVDHLEEPAWTGLDDLLPFVSKLTGIVTDLMPAATGVESLHSYTALFGFGRGAANLQAFKNSVLSQAAGVGTTPEDAKVGAICEALERYSGMCHGDEPALRASYVQLDPAGVIHPNACMLYSDRQYEARDAINGKGAVFDVVPQPFDETIVVDWTGVWSLTAQRFKLLPSAYLFFGYPESPTGPMFWADSNGCAAGKTLTDAIRRGLFELVERDSVAIWWYNRLRRPRVDLESFRCEYFNRFVDAYAHLHRSVWVLDITTDLRIPAFVAISRSTSGGPEDILLSFGAHVDARAAIEHALSEMNHLLPAVLPENRTPLGDYAYPETSQKTWWRTATTASEPYLLPDCSAAALECRFYEPSENHHAAEQVTAVCGRLQERGLEVLVLDQTRPDVAVPVAKVIVPGMRHFWARFAPGRLYDVPVTMGWLDARRLEEELNPIAMFL